MSIDPEKKNELDQAWMDALLKEAYSPSNNREDDRVARLFETIQSQEVQSRSVSELPNGSSNVSRGRPKIARWISIALAASLFLAAGLWSMLGSTSQQAAAAVARALKAVPPTREYSIQILARRPKRDVESRATLYLDDRDRFVLHYPGWSGLTDLWIGGSPNRRWIVPRLGPAVVGNESLIGSWMAKKDATSPYLHLVPVLKRMEKAYDLQMLDNADIDRDGVRVPCQVVVGTLRNLRSNERRAMLPTRIQLWADRESGVAEKLVLNWARAEDQWGPIEWTIQLKGSPSLSEDFFEIESHVAPGRRIRTVEGAEELDQIELQ